MNRKKGGKKKGRKNIRCLRKEKKKKKRIGKWKKKKGLKGVRKDKE